MHTFKIKLGLYALVCSLYFELSNLSFGKDCTYIKKIEIKNEKIFKSVTEYNCKKGNQNSQTMNTSKVLNSHKPSVLIIKNQNKINQTNNRAVSHSEYMNMIYSSKPSFFDKPNGKLETILYPILRILYF